MAKSITSLSVGDKIKFGKYQVETETPQEIIWKIADKNHNGYPIDSITLLTEKIIDLRGFDAKEPNNSNNDRQNYGNNRYKDSNIRQWLNKSGSNWFVKSHSADETPNDVGMAQPTGYDDKSGFLSCFTAEELSKILDTTLTVAKNTVTDGGGSETVTDKVFLLSTTETGLANENSIAEGSKLALFSDDASRIAYLTQQAFSNTLSGSKPSTIGDGWYYWLRTSFSSSSYRARDVCSDGTLGYRSVYDGNYGVRPALNLKSGILVSDTTDSDGCYTVDWSRKYSIMLDKPITATTIDKLMKYRINPKLNNVDMIIKEMDAEKIIYESKELNTDKVDLSIEGKDTKIDKIAYVIS